MFNSFLLILFCIIVLFLIKELRWIVRVYCEKCKKFTKHKRTAHGFICVECKNIIKDC